MVTAAHLTHFPRIETPQAFPDRGAYGIFPEGTHQLFNTFLLLEGGSSGTGQSQLPESIATN